MFKTYLNIILPKALYLCFLNFLCAVCFFLNMVWCRKSNIKSFSSNFFNSFFKRFFFFFYRFCFEFCKLGLKYFFFVSCRIINIRFFINLLSNIFPSSNCIPKIFFLFILIIFYLGFLVSLLVMVL